MKPVDSSPPQIGAWRVLDKIGEGSFGSVYSADLSQQPPIPVDKDEKLAIKTECISNVKPMLELEHQVYASLQGTKGVPKIYQYAEEQTYSYMVMERLEITLDKYAAKQFPKFVATDTALQIMSQTLQIVQRIHEKGYLYRDLKPANFMLKEPYEQIYIIDFGLCKRYFSNRHIALKYDKKMIGTPLFCSLNTHAGLEQSRRDDIESWLYTCLYFSMELPWEPVIAKKQLAKEAQYQQIYKIKKEVNWALLVQDKNKQAPRHSRVPSCVPRLFQYACKLGFEDEPDYKFMQQLLRQEYRKLAGSEMQQSTINWVTKIGPEMSPERKKPEQENENKRVGKINFKIGPKPKIQAQNLQQTFNSLKNKLG